MTGHVIRGYSHSKWYPPLALQRLHRYGGQGTEQLCDWHASTDLQAQKAFHRILRAQEVQRGKQLAERAQSTSKLLREGVNRGQRRGLKADGSPLDPALDPSGVAGLTKRLEDYAAAFEQISAATGARPSLLVQAGPDRSLCGLRDPCGLLSKLSRRMAAACWCGECPRARF